MKDDLNVYDKEKHGNQWFMYVQIIAKILKTTQQVITQTI